jgi:ribosomal protein S18 acetylase RimI-like enzyme
LEIDDGLAGYVHRLAARSWASRRIGEALLQWAGARCAEAGKPYLRLDTTSRNPAICAYYKRLGFEQRGIIDERIMETDALRKTRDKQGAIKRCPRP